MIDSNLRLAPLILALIMLGAAPLLVGQSRETGAILGTVTDIGLAPLPGTSVTLTGRTLMGRRAAVADAQGAFRFPALPPGEYSVTAELAGFKTAALEGIRLTTTISLTVNIALEEAAIIEEVTVLARAPTVDIRSVETASVTLSAEVLRNIPYSQLSGDIVNLAPGANCYVAYGASRATGIASTVDGVDVSEPMGGGVWVLLDHNIVEEAKVMGVGLPAEYGGFSGVIFNLVTKSGGNDFAGHFELDYQGLDTDRPRGLWQAGNIGAYSEDFPELTPPRLRMFDGSAHLGGPIRKDRFWFYAGAQWYETWRYATGFPLPADSVQPRVFAKVTAQPTPTLTLSAWLEADVFNIDDGGGSAVTAVEATSKTRSFEVVGNFSLTKILSPESFYDLKFSFFSGYFTQEPAAGMDAVCRREIANSNYKTGSHGQRFRVDPARYQANGSFTHYAEDFVRGSHDFKFGAEIERSTNRTVAGYTGPEHTIYWDYDGLPYLAYQYEGYTTDTRYTRFDIFAQDAWQVTKRLNINAGLRFTSNRGTVKGMPGPAYAAARLAPRLGFALDLLGDRATVLKAHYGRFTEAMFTSIHERMNPASSYSDFIGYYWNGTAWIEFDRVVHENLYRMDPDIRHPYFDQWVIGLERELFKDTSLSVSYICRNWKDLISIYDDLADYEIVSFDVPGSGSTLDIYERTSGNEHAFVLTNVEPGDPWIPDRYYRKYRGIEILFNKRFSNRWQLLGSYVLSKTRGTADNLWVSDIGWGFHDGLSTADPNFWTNAEGNATYDPKHMFKLQGTYVVPWAEISLSIHFRAISGDTWTTRFRTPRLAQGRVIVFAEPRGSGRYGTQSSLDMRLEKLFKIGRKYSLGLIADVFNVFNADTVTNWGSLLNSDYFPDSGFYPLTDGHILYEIVNPRQARLGVRLVF